MHAAVRCHGISFNHLKNQVSPVDSVLVTIITDGYENDSKEFNATAIGRLVDEMKERGWLFTYIGANQDALAVAQEMNIRNALNFVQDEAGTQEMFRRDRKARERFNQKKHDQIQFCCRVGSGIRLDYEKQIAKLSREMAKCGDYFEEYKQ